MSKYKHEDKKEYLIAEGPYWKVWNNGIIEFNEFSDNWIIQNPDHAWERRLEFLKLWENIPIDSWTTIDWDDEYRIEETSEKYGCQKFLGFKNEQCPECKKCHMVWENKIQLCKGCGYIHAFIVDDS